MTSAGAGEYGTRGLAGSPASVHGDALGPVELTEPELVDWGRRIGRSSRTPLVLALRGELGSGKSVLARAVARGAGVAGPMPSPTFNLMYTYDAEGITIRHLDLYRLDRPVDVWELGWSELGGQGEIVLIEWPERAESFLPDVRWDVELRHVPGRPSARSVRARRKGPAPDLPPLPR